MGFGEDKLMATATLPHDPTIVEFDVRTDEMLVNMGPQHPSTHGVLRLVLRTDGEIVSEMISPSVRRTRRSTPWVLGCWGPMLTSISSVRTSNSTTVGSWSVAVAMC